MGTIFQTSFPKNPTQESPKKSFISQFFHEVIEQNCYKKRQADVQVEAMFPCVILMEQQMMSVSFHFILIPTQQTSFHFKGKMSKSVEFLTISDTIYRGILPNLNTLDKENKNIIALPRLTLMRAR